MNNPIGNLRQTVRTLAITLFLGCALLAPAVMAGEQPQMQETVLADAQAERSGEAAPTEGGSYAARDANAPAALADFKGGDTVVVIGGTTLVIILLIVLIIVLI